MAVFRTLPRRRKRSNLLVICLLVSYVLWSEWLALHLKALLWRVPPKSTNSLTIMLIADPQLIGYKNEPYWMGWFSRWDSDRYMRRAFSKALAHTQPEYVIFLGDLFDEGVQMQANEDDFTRTLGRFHSIFPLCNTTNRIYIAGDNDIGGEMEHVSSVLENRFNWAFPSRVQTSNILDFSMINIFDDQRVKKIVPGDGLKILLSHVPVIRSFSSPEQIFGNYRPDLVLSAHDHTAEFYVRKSHSPHFTRHEAYKGLRFSISTGIPLVEIQVPTLSYRMGVSKMAVGVLQVDFVPNSPRAFTIAYENLWLPGRYPQLYGYFVLLVGLVLYVFGESAWGFLRIERVCKKLCPGRSFCEGQSRVQQKYVSV